MVDEQDCTINNLRCDSCWIDQYDYGCMVVGVYVVGRGRWTTLTPKQNHSYVQQQTVGSPLKYARRSISLSFLLFSLCHSISRRRSCSCICLMKSAALLRMVTFGARWFSSRSGIWPRKTWKLYFRSFLRFLSRTLCDARLCSSSDSVPSVVLDPTELSLCNRLVW